MMKTERIIHRVKCPGCTWILGIPDKVIKRKVRCPKCECHFTPLADSVERSTLPLFAPQHTIRNSEGSDIHESFTIESNPNGPASSPARVIVSKAPSVKTERQPPIEKKTRFREPPKREPPKQPLVARIIVAETIQQAPATADNLPKLKLVEEQKPLLERTEFSTHPVFLGILVCFSVLVSGVLLLLASQNSSGDRAALNEVRAEIERFYETRIDIELKPYQHELREAQLAHSRGDREAETSAYRNVMARFHAEDRSRFAGVTGSPTADAELEKLVSIMLGNGRSKLSRFF